ncbi:NlpC/P60 family protein [Marinomonas fungiae]|uniref:NlpC/P60 family protein n=1 Tax=Marinomonas fungiae TaxID=1137284 RepID=UPI003A90C1BC
MPDAQYFMRILATLLLAITLTACSSIPSNTISIHSGNLSSAEESTITQHLYRQYQDWRGTPYAYGGMSKRGVDCSGFVYLTLRDQFGAYLPRTTEKQVQTGYHIDEDELAAGDLVFFKTGSKVRHVGIYMEDGKFLHASTSRGVIISSLDNVYWKEHYWHARRIR